MHIIPVFEKSPAEIVTVILDWEEYLSGATISSVSFPVLSGLTNVSSSHDDTTTSIKISGGTTIHSTLLLTTRIVTSDGETVEQSVNVRIITK